MSDSLAHETFESRSLTLLGLRTKYQELRTTEYWMMKLHFISDFRLGIVDLLIRRFVDFSHYPTIYHQPKTKEEYKYLTSYVIFSLDS